MTNNETIFMKVHGHIATIYINRPKKRNALSKAMWEKLTTLVDQCNQDKRVKVIVFRSTVPESFSAGADIQEFQTLRRTPSDVMKFNEITDRLEKKIADGLKPTIAMIQGFCIGGGCEIAVACDFRFSDQSGKFGITPAKLGIIYSTSATKRLVDLIGPSYTKDLLYTGRIIDAEEAWQIGLINRIFHTDELERETYRFAKQIANNAQMSVRGTKKIIHEILQGATTESEEVQQLMIESVHSADYKEGVAAFLEKRPPKFTYS